MKNLVAKHVHPLDYRFGDIRAEAAVSYASANYNKFTGSDTAVPLMVHRIELGASYLLPF